MRNDPSRSSIVVDFGTDGRRVTLPIGP